MQLIRHAFIYTGAQEERIIEDGAVAVDGAFIREVGEDRVLSAKYPEAEVLDAEGKFCMPGFINAHEHIYSEFARGCAFPGGPFHGFLDVLEKVWWPLDRVLTKEDIYYSALCTYIECIKNGVTTVIDHHAGYGAIEGSLSEIARAAEQTGVRTCLCYEVSDRDGFNKCRKAIDENASFIEETGRKNTDMLKALFGLHASFTLSDDTLQAVRRANENGAGYHVHIAEGAYDEKDCEEKYGCSIVQRFHQEGILGSHTIAAHCIHISEKDMGILKDTDTMVVHNPESNMNNAVGSPNVLAMYDRGITVGLGTDGYGQDMLRSMQTAAILQKYRHGNPARGTGEAEGLLLSGNPEIVRRIFGVSVGNLKEGAAADIILMNYSPFTPLDENTVGSHLLFGLTGALTDTVFINGRCVMQGRKILTVDEEAIEREARELSPALWKRIR
ncbi:MAG: putative aminohydrolase SsnA [Lachnospiraceae bacterium]|nr:putative aminohydrolase SsnA [Lachnospiraceae bacterium]